jgi:hypothetical protein
LRRVEHLTLDMSAMRSDLKDVLTWAAAFSVALLLLVS